jgi:hypothetical protein
MAIVARPAHPSHPAPRGLPPIAGARSVGDGFYEIAVQPGAIAADVSAALDAIPFDAIPFDAAFVEFYDDVDKILIFKHAPPAAPACVRVPARPAGPRPAATAAAAVAVAATSGRPAYSAPRRRGCAPRGTVRRLTDDRPSADAVACGTDADVVRIAPAA